MFGFISYLLSLLFNQRRNPGGIKDREDKRDILYERVAEAMNIPIFDWDKGFDIETELGIKLPVKDQNGSGSCGGQAWSQYGGVLEAIFDKTFEERSAKFIYSQAFYPQPGGGSTGRDLSKIAVLRGFAREQLCLSYDAGKPPEEPFMERISDISDEALKDGYKNRALYYSNVKPDIDLFAQAIKNNGGMCLGLDGQDNGTWRSAYPKPPTVRVWGHWMYAGKAKLINGKKYIGCINSWGTSTGENGWQWFGEEWFKGAMWPGWTFLWNPKPDFKFNFTKDLSLNFSSKEVTALQVALFLDGYEDGTFQDSDWKNVYQVMTFGGFFGEATEANVKRFQTKYHLPVTGKIGQVDRDLLNQKFLTV